MSKFSYVDRKKLLSNPNVLKLTENQIIYSPEFKLSAVKKRLEGMEYRKIFTEAGIDQTLFYREHAKSRITAWTKIFNEEGAEGLLMENRGTGTTTGPGKGRPKKKYDLQDIPSMTEHLAYLQEENRFLKKLHALAKKYPK